MGVMSNPYAEPAAGPPIAEKDQRVTVRFSGPLWAHFEPRGDPHPCDSESTRAGALECRVFVSDEVLEVFEHLRS